MPEPESILLRHLRQIDSKLDRVIDDIGGVKLRLSSLESHVAGLHGDNAITHQRIDRVEARLDRIERRLELNDA